MKKTKSSFKGKVMGASERKATQAFSYGYLKLTQGVNVFLPVPGKTVTLDFLPYEVTSKNHPDKYAEEDIAVPGSLWYRLPFKAHRNVGAKNDSVVCLQTFGKKCPICEYKVKRGKEGADKDELGALRPSDRYLYVVNPLDSDKYEAGKFYVFDISNAMFQKLLDEELREESVPEDFMDLEEGVSLKIRFSSETIGNSKPFAEAKKITVIDRKKPYKESVLDQIPKLDELLTILSYEELEAKFFELDTEDVTEDDDKPRGKKSATTSDDQDEDKPKRGKKTVEKDEDDDDDEAPVTRRKKESVPAKNQKYVKPDPEEDEDEEDDEEEKTITWDELLLLNEKKLIKYCSANKLDVDPDDFEDNEKGLREAIAEELGVTIPKKGKAAPAPIAKKDQCPACKGTGKDAKGKMCKVCMGTGVKQAVPEDEDEDEDKDDDLPFKKGAKQSPDKKGSTTEECPSGFTFGKDIDRHDECDDCPLWDACMAEKKKKK